MEIGKPKWIWLNGEAQADSYGEFYTSFLYQRGSCELRISADSDYTVFINGRFVQSGQYRDFPYEKVYDRFDMTEHLIPGENHIAIVVWYYGLPNSSYYPGPAGLWFEIRNVEVCAECSGTHTLSRLSRSYRNGRKKKITAQLGLSYSYDATQEDGWKNGVLSGFSESRADERPAPAVERPVKKLTVDHRAESKLIRSGNGVYLFDLGREEVGYLTLCVKSAVRQNLTVVWGEHIVDGCVRRRIGSRDFSSELTVGEGITEYTNYFRRLGLRYLELHAEQALCVEYVSVLPCCYPLKRIPADFGDPLKNRIYQTAVRTLELCMHDHYEDCPWREQAMYAMDGRNQMLCGYYAFGEFDFPRACLLLMSKDRRSDGLLQIRCFASGEQGSISGLYFGSYRKEV